MKEKKNSKKEDKEKNPAQALRERLFNCQRSRQHTLNLSNLELTDMPPDISKFGNLKVLNASKNQFVELYPMAKFRLLEELHMNRNFIRSVENAMFSNHPELRVLDLSRNEIIFIPETISKLPLLEVLNLSYNKIKAVPECMSELSSLQQVDLSHNNISSIGNQFERMIQLGKLDVTSNPDLDVEHLPLRTRRLYEKQILLKSKSERRALVQRALGIRRSVLQKEQSDILRHQIQSQENNMVNQFP